MARTKGKVTVNNFTGGLQTDFHPLNTPQNISVEEDNCDLDRKGFRRRRLGFTYEEGYSFGTLPDGVVGEVTYPTIADAYYIKAYNWKSVNNNADLQFLVVQFGNILYFYDKSYEPLSTGLKDFIVDLDDFAAPGVASTATAGIGVASGKGVLFVVGELIDPFYIVYNEDDTITTTEITIRIRDLELQDRVTDYEALPTSISDNLKYDLYNQGWGYNKVTGNDSEFPGSVVAQDQVAIDFYFSKTGNYPPRTKPWWIGNRTPVDPGESGFNKIFDPNGVYDPTYAGNTLAPLGHFILEAFRKDRTAEAGFGAFTVQLEATRPTAVAFAAGRVFFGHKNLVYFSQFITEDLDAAGDCYQQADPTAEDINELIATDGGVILIPTSGEAIKFESKENSIIAFYDNGIWAIGGGQPGDGFTATSHSVSKITGEGALSSRTIFSVEGDLTFWTDNGINVLTTADSTTGSFKVSSLTEGKIQDFYDTIPPLAKEFATGAYDKIKKRIVWLFTSSDELNDEEDRFYYDRVLNYDLTKQAFFPYTISELPIDQSPKISDVFNKHSSSLVSATEVVTDDGVVVTDGGVPVTVRGTALENVGQVNSNVKYLIAGPTIVQTISDTGLLCGDLAVNNIPVTTGNSGEVTTFSGNLNGEFFDPSGVTCGDPSFCDFECSMTLANINQRLIELDYNFYFPYLRAYDFDAAIPSTAIITGVEVRFDIPVVTGSSTLEFSEINLAWGALASTFSSDNKADELAAIRLLENTTVILGSSSDDWGSTLTPAIVNTSDFGIVFKVSRPDIDPGNPPTYGGTLNMGFAIDNVQLKVFYRL